MTTQIEAIKACLETASELDQLALDRRRHAGLLLAKLRCDNPATWYAAAGVDRLTGELLIARAAGIEKR